MVERHKGTSGAASSSSPMQDPSFASQLLSPSATHSHCAHPSWPESLDV